ncbi:RelA/SpoT family protein [Candidatus Peregrinibacteria bacterium]|nr:RelA/SpoT family protein [Candidatus Peregrinibacteria bacterium]
MNNSQNVNIEKELSDIIAKIKEYMPGFNDENFVKAFKFAKKAHEGQMRKDNATPYIFHPIATVKILTKLHVDEDTLIAAITHDVPEDTTKTLKDIERLFGKKVAFLVNGITKLSKVHYRYDMEERQVESLKKLLIHSAKDPRVILVKLADRLHNMRTINFVKPEKRIRIAKETLEIYVPIANLLGIEKIKKPLEDLCFKILFPKDYEIIEEKLAETKIRQANLLEETIKAVKDAIKKEDIEIVEIYGREKAAYSVFHKTKRDDKTPDELEDLLALRIITKNIKDCYVILGIIHSLFRPKPGRFKDYIAVTKPNGYQSLHTIVFGIKGQITEFQIRTEKMHLEAQYGIASHYFYRESQKKGKTLSGTQSKWAQKILEYQKTNYDNNANFIEDLKLDVFHDRIFTFTPKGDTIDLPKSATAIDFAYAIHTDVGNNAIKAEINGEIMPLTSVLKTGDIIKILISDIPKGPNREWLIFAKTNIAKNKIRESLHKISRKKKLSIGRRLLQKEFDRAGAGLLEEMSKKKIRELILKVGAHAKCKTLDDVMVAIGEGSINPVHVIQILYPTKGFLKQDAYSIIKRFLHLRAPDKKRITIKIKAIDRIGIGRDLLSVLSDQHINVASLKVTPFRLQNIFAMHVIMDIDSFEQLSYICEKLENIDEVLEVRRQISSSKALFYVMAVATFILWVVHPFLTIYLSSNPTLNLPHDILMYGGMFMLFYLVYLLQKATKRTFPELRETGKSLWILTFIIGNIALLIIILEFYVLEKLLNWIFIFIIIVLMYAYLITEYIRYKKGSNSDS